MDTKMTTAQARECLVQFMEQNFADKTFHRYIRGQRVDGGLAGDFAYQMASSLQQQAKQHDQLLEALREIREMAVKAQVEDGAIARMTCMAISDAVTSALTAAGES